jgi:hypothetical protein
VEVWRCGRHGCGGGRKRDEAGAGGRGSGGKPGFQASKNMAGRPLRKSMVTMSCALDGSVGESSPKGIPAWAQVDLLHDMFNVYFN